MKKVINVENFYVLLWGLYFTQGTIFPQGSFLSRLILIIYLSLSAWFAIRVNLHNNLRVPYIKALNALVLLFVVYGFLSIVESGGIDSLKAVLLSLLPTYFCYYVVLKNQLTDSWFRWVLFYFAFVIGVQYINYITSMEEILRKSEEGFTINVAYQILSLLPLLFFWRKKPLIQFGFLTIIVFAVVSTAKRGAIIIAILFLLFYIWKSVEGSNKKRRILNLVIISVFLVAIVYYTYDYFMSNDYLQRRLQNTLEGDSSGRDSIFRSCWRIFLNSNLLGILFGHGMNATVKLIDIEAHNDWLEILVDQGLFGVTVYLIYWFVFFKSWLKDKGETRNMWGALVILYFISTFFSMSFNAMVLPSNFVLGYCLAKNVEKNNLDKSNINNAI